MTTCLLLCYDLRDQNQISCCSAFVEARSRCGFFYAYDFFSFITPSKMFDINWENDFFFIENMDGEAQCVVCYKIICRKALFFLKRHYETCHGPLNDLRGHDRKVKLLQLKAEFFLKFIINETTANNCNNLPLNSQKKSLPHKKASYVVALSLAKQCRPFEDGIFFLNLTTDILSCFGEKCHETMKLCQDIPLSRRTITRRTEDISKFIKMSAKERLINCKYFSISLDESTDINNICQLIICIKTVNANLECFEEMFEVVSLHGHVTGQVLYDALDVNVFAFADKNKLASICSDGAKVMRGKNKGLLGILNKNGINCPAFHCVIHQQALFSKELGMKNTMDVVVKIINIIRGGHNSLTHRKFKDFLENLNSDYGDLLLYTEVRWLSRGKSLERLFHLRKEVLEFLKTLSNKDTKHLTNCLENPDFLLDFAFLCDITEILNDLNLCLQGKNIKIFHLNRIIHQFSTKLDLLINQLKSNSISNLKKTSSIFIEFNFNTFDCIQKYAKIVESIKKNYNDRFQDLKFIKKTIEIHDNPLRCEIEEQDAFLHEELHKMRNDFEVPMESGEKFWQKIDDTKYFNLKNEIYKLYSMFGTTYNCEVAFSSMKLILSKLRNRLTDQHIGDLLRIKEYKGNIDLDRLVEL